MKGYKFMILALFIPLFLVMESCQKEYANPNAATKDAVLANVDGLLGLVVGIRKEFSAGPTPNSGGLSGLYNAVSANGLTTKELYVLNTGNGELAALEAGKSTVGGTNAFIRNIWSNCNQVKAHSQFLIDNYQNIPDPATAAYVRASGHFFKALAIGTMAQFWEQVTTEVLSSSDFLAGKRSGFVSRNAALEEAIELLHGASNALGTTPAPAAFTAKVGNSINLPNSIQALLARYHNMLGEHNEAISAADKVDLASKSTFTFDAVNQNPIYRTSLVNNNTYNGLPNFGLSGELAPEAGDGRIAFYLGANTAPVKVAGFFKSDTDPIPVYLPGEILLIKAEAYARLGGNDNLVNAIADLDVVRTKSADIYGLNANLPPYSGAVTQEAVLKEIYKQRCIELYMTGMKLEDSRRFGRPGPNDAGEERNRNFYPYPTVERDNNPNTPSDPTI